MKGSLQEGGKFMVTVGVLALQGAFKKHIEMLESLNVKALMVRNVKDLELIDALIIPGGESTTISRQLKFTKLDDKIQEFGKTKPIFGTCAGLILISKEIYSSEMKPFGFIDISVERNAFGRQVDSFKANIEVYLSSKKQPSIVPAFFIRAPRIRKCGSDVEVLATFEGEPILVKQGHHLAATFHPELTDDPLIHRYFLSLIKTSKSSS